MNTTTKERLVAAANELHKSDRHDREEKVAAVHTAALAFLDEAIKSDSYSLLVDVDGEQRVIVRVGPKGSVAGEADRIGSEASR